MIWWQVLGITFGAIILVYVLTYIWGFFFARSLKERETDLLLVQSNQLLQKILTILETTCQQKPFPEDNPEPSYREETCSKIQKHVPTFGELAATTQVRQKSRDPLQKTQD